MLAYSLGGHLYNLQFANGKNYLESYDLVSVGDVLVTVGRVGVVEEAL